MLMPAFPASVIIDPDRSRVMQDAGYDNDVNSLNRPRLVKRRRTTTTFEIVLHGLTKAKWTEVLAFMEANRGADDVAIVYDQVSAVGRIVGPIRHSRINYENYEIEFALQAFPENVSGGWLDASAWDDSTTWAD